MNPKGVFVSGWVGYSSTLRHLESVPPLGSSPAPMLRACPGGAMKDATISVIIPCYNRAGMIGDAIQSSLDQTHSPSEVIVVDDGSTDDSLAVARSFGPPVRTLHQENAGPAAARNAGIEAASGEFVAFLDSDDLWKPAKLERQIELFEAMPHLAVVHTLVDWGDGFPSGHGPRVEASAHYPDENDDWARLFCSAVMYTPTVMVHRSVLRRTGRFDVDLQYWEDMNLWLRAAIHGPVGLVRERLAILRRGPYPDGRSPLSMLPVYWYRSYARALSVARSTLGSEEYRRCRAHLRDTLDRHMVGAHWDGNPKAVRRLCLPAMRHGPRRLKALAYLVASILPQGARDLLRSTGEGARS
ncbi:MAG: glycosyltransferase family 2 protein [Gemmatimonadales bacterium]|nr:MAG: glycosyltransferase family 2 protein [Gemmatimonadales bacterium]